VGSRGGGGTRPPGWWRRLALLLVVLVSGISVAGYVMSSMTVNGTPPPRVFQGWLAVLQPLAEPLGDQVKLIVLSHAAGDHPLVGYTVVACGPHPYRADLVIGGAAQLTDVRRVPVQDASLLPPLRMQRLADLELAYGGPLNFGPVQIIRITLPHVACATDPPGRPAGSFTGAAEAITGFAAAPIQRRWSGPLGWWHGPHAAQAWPLTGTLPGVTSGGAFTGLAGLSGMWLRPDADIQISAVDVPLSQSVDSAVPAPSGASMLSWSGTDAMDPTAQLTDTSSAALLQDWIVVFAVGLGIGGSMLASLLFEWLRPRPALVAAGSGDVPVRPEQSARTGGQRSTGPLARPSDSLTLVIGAGLIIAWIMARRTRHRT
jgi:hypothetical protein